MDIEIDPPKVHSFDWKKLSFVLIPVLVIGGVLFAKLGFSKGRAEKDYIAATNTFAEWDQALCVDSKKLEELSGILSNYPELQAAFDGAIGQNLLSAYHPSDATPYIERAISRTAQPLYKDFAKTSVTISEGNYEKALEEALALKEQMVGKKEGSALYAFNLLRIAVLCQELENHDGEKISWNEFKSLAETPGHRGAQQLAQHLSVQETSLNDFIGAREEQLSSHQR